MEWAYDAQIREVWEVCRSDIDLMHIWKMHCLIPCRGSLPFTHAFACKPCIRKDEMRVLSWTCVVSGCGRIPCDPRDEYGSTECIWHILKVGPRPGWCGSRRRFLGRRLDEQFTTRHAISAGFLENSGILESANITSFIWTAMPEFVGKSRNLVGHIYARVVKVKEAQECGTILLWGMKVQCRARMVWSKMTEIDRW